ncbi:hypothetical protein L6164_028077 [Bauhinia variegata]|uniref:Uncharacterized protein n=1 Tax=Bauhinia variegata TaxID=167791 RepID=A0ACB9LWK9_BAUVA|nr:hypothetical protein L6164_028077 [Bauhinia variegata]
MDYDDNDYQGQNLHLAGEGNTKFPPVLRPYALPKFDFDESLQGHLRFDSLVETEVFLGIENNEDNQWIDAYSRGNSGIEFSSSAAESCPISRHNNVWSEATSSESVEMLLKSVGQEEFIPRQTVIEESDGNELACLAKQMEPNSKPDDKNILKGDVTNVQLPDSSVHGSVSELKEDVRRDQSHHIVSQVHEEELSTDRNSNNQELNDSCGNINLPMSERSLFADVKSNNANQSEVQTVADESLDGKTLDNSSASAVQTVITVESMQNISTCCDALHIQNEKNQVTGIGDEQKDCLPTKNDKQDLESSILNQDADVDKQNMDSNASGSDSCHLIKPLYSVSREEALEGGSLVENLEPGVSNIEESVGLVLDGDSHLQKEERCKVVCSRNPSGDSTSEDAILLKDTITNDHSALNTCDLPIVAIKGDNGNGSEGQVVGISNSSPNAKQNVDPVENKTYIESGAVKENELSNSSHLIDTDILASQSEARTSIVDDNISKIGEGNGDSKVGSTSSFSVATSVTSCILGESTPTCVNNEVEGQGDPEKFNDKESTKAVPDSSQMHSDANQSHLVDNGLGSSALSGCRLETDLTNSAVSDVTAVNDRASQVMSEKTSLTSSDMKDVPSPSRNETSPPVGSSSVDEKEHFVAKIAEKADISTPVGSSEKETAPCPIPKTDKHQAYDNSVQLLCETINDCQQNVGMDISKRISETQGVPSDKVIQECTKDIETSPLLCESISKQGEEVAASSSEQDKEKVQENYEKLPSKISGDILFANGGSISSAPLPDSHAEFLEAGGPPTNPADITGGPPVSSGSSSHIQKDENEVQGSSGQKTLISEFISSDATNVLSPVQDAKGNNASKDEKNLTSEVTPVVKLPKKTSAESASKVVRKKQSVPATTASELSTVVEGSPSSFGLGPTKTKISGDVSHGIPLVSEAEIARSASKGTSERKTRRASVKKAGKESSRRGSQAKETTPARQPERGDKSSNVSLSPSPGFQLMQSNEMQQYRHIDCTSTKPFALLNASTSSLPDLNTSASPPVLFQQPFTDLQQVQLRAQIFVYGALIQGTAPDEAYMISAFGGPDGGKSIWENAWRACMERQHGQKSHPINPETPLQPRSGPRASEFAAKQSTFQGKSVTSSLGRTSSNVTPSVINPLIPISSPLWSVPTPSRDSLQSSALARGSVVDYPQTLTSLHPYQTPPLRNFNASWISQTPVRGPWIASPTPAADNSSHLSASPVSDTIKSSTVKGSSLPPSSSIKNVTPSLPAPSGGSPSIFIPVPLLDKSNDTVSPAQHSSDPKHKKRKKVSVSQDMGHKALQLQSQLESTSAASSHISTSAAIVTLAENVPKTTIEKAIVPLSPLTSCGHLKNDRSVEKILSEETLAKVKEARKYAEEAAADSAAAVSHSLEIWNQLDKQKNSGLVPDIEAKLASAAVSVAAAAAVAKAAAAAANVASNAALQAKLMADEALLSSGYENSFQNSGISLSEGMGNLAKATPASILKVANGSNSSSSIIIAAKEAARRRVEAASAATKGAENMDAIVKAAELAAEAVSQAGKVVTMGDPLPLSALVEAGPEDCWRTRQPSQQVGLLKDMTRGMVNVGNGGDSTQVTLNIDILSNEMGKQTTASEKSPLHRMNNERSDNRRRSMDGIANSININERNLRGLNGHEISDLVSPSPINVVPESETEILSSSLIVGNGSEKQTEVGIKEGSLVEVLREGEGFKAAWFTANVLSLKDGKAYVCYTVLLADGGPLKEWVTLEGEGNKPPRIRIARPLVGLRYEGTRKRRRAAMGDYAWSVGDRVDAWIQESWWEGVVTEKNKKDATTLTVHFPASGETTVVRAWHLRPSLIWKDGKWTECSKVGANESSTHEGDTPHEKRAKLVSHAIETKGKDKMSKGTDDVESVNPNELRLLDLTENEKVFNIGKSSRNENKPDTQRMARTGLQKEGSRVIFGVPKPGKKRKFMEVSKHYVADRSDKINDGNDSVKLANFLVPQGSGSRGWKNNSKAEAKEKRGADPKPKTSKSGKPQNVLGRTIPPKNNPSTNNFSHPSDPTEHTEKIKDSGSHFKNASGSENLKEIASFSASDGAGEGQIYSSLATSTDAPSSKTSSSRASKGKLAPAGGKLGKIEEEKALNSNLLKATSEVIEPRRSNRRIQPTSRLLEGLQSSLIISKIPSVSHDKSHKNQNRSAPRGHNQG